MRYTFDEICESQDFDHNQEFVIYDEYYELQQQLSKAQADLELAVEALEFYREYEKEISNLEYELDKRATNALKQIKETSEKENRN